MTPKVQNVAPAPVCIAPKPLIYWSGREDSNLRPLPPEGVSPRRTRCFPVLFHGSAMSSDSLCSCTVPAQGSTPDLGALSLPHPIAALHAERAA